MRIVSTLVGLLLFVATIALLMAPVAYATPPTWVSGKFDQSIPETNVEIRFADGNMIVHEWGGGGFVTGTFEGKWIHDQWVVIHPSGMATITGVWDTPDGMKVNGVEGTIHVRYSGTADLATGVVQGQWVIISGTGDLANLRGQGTMWFDPAIDPVYFGYTVQYHFES